MFNRIYTSLALISRLPSSAVLYSSSPSSSVPSKAQSQAMSVQEIVENAIENHKITIFSKSWCPYSTKAKSLIKKEYEGVDTEIIEIDKRDDGDAIQQYLLKKTGQRTVPNVFVNKQHVGGYDNTYAAFEEGKLTQLVNA